MGLGSSRHSAQQVILCNSSSLASPFPKMFLRALMAPLIISSNTPLKLGAVGGLNFHSIKWCLLVSLTTWLSRLSASCQNYLSAPTKFVLLWESVTWHPLLDIICWKGWWRSPCWAPKAISKCTTVVVWQVNKHRYLLFLGLHDLVSLNTVNQNGP